MPDNFRRSTRRQEAACGDKEAHPTREKANAHRVRLLRERPRWKKGAISVYECEFCSFFHVGNSRPRPREED